jgi:hypothetical protein
MASKETKLRENELQALHHSIEQFNSGNSEVSFQNGSLENQKTSKRKRANQADVQTQTQTPEICKTLGTPTGIVQPLVVNHEAQDMPSTISFPTMDLPQIEMFHNPCSSLSEVSSLQSSTVELSPEATLLLNEQLRKYVQLLTQMHLITAQQPGLESVTEE